MTDKVYSSWELGATWAEERMDYDGVLVRGSRKAQGTAPPEESDRNRNGTEEHSSEGGMKPDFALVKRSQDFNQLFI